MAIKVFAHGGRYHVEVSPPHAPTWRSSEPPTATEVLEKLSSLGVHSTDATDALDEAGANWRPSHDAEVLRRRKEAANSQREHGEVPSVRKLDDSRAEGAELIKAAALPLTIATALEVLEGLGFRVVEQCEGEMNNRLFVFGREDCRVRLVSDRGEWSLSVSFDAGEWIHPDVWEAYLDDFPLAGELSDLTHQIEFLHDRFEEIAAASRPYTESQLVALGEEYMRRRLGLGPADPDKQG